MNFLSFSIARHSIQTNYPVCFLLKCCYLINCCVRAFVPLKLYVRGKMISLYVVRRW